MILMPGSCPVQHAALARVAMRSCYSPSSVFKRERVAWRVALGTVQSFLELRAFKSIVRIW